MTNYMDQTTKSLMGLAKYWKNRIENPEEINKALVESYGQEILDSRNLVMHRAKADQYKIETTKEAVQDIRKQQEQIASKLKEYEARLHRCTVQASNGDQLVSAYAKQNSITEDMARQELDKYAESKKSLFKDDNLADQYAAIRNFSSLPDGKDKKEAKAILDKHIEATEPEADRKNRLYMAEICNKSPLEIISFYSSAAPIFIDKFK